MTIILNRRDAAYVRSVMGSLPPGYDVLDDSYVEVTVRPDTIERMRRAAEQRQAAFLFLDTVALRQPWLAMHLWRGVCSCQAGQRKPCQCVETSASLRVQGMSVKREAPQELRHTVAAGSQQRTRRLRYLEEQLRGG
jgi:hypothetical protein